ncbi:steroidogenic acute regulatory protein-like [Anaeramoeba flamelloides]|uniref:Steroidogenic acute regulatory protein-like n=1 Tax=Anaeramoeba flamelloides TaxID=1746091 RepID=A0AAV7YXX6_9EUKA|nr:steroidogenic acute regulatory protein-like [Anaeramoeba flamelloides]
MHFRKQISTLYLIEVIFNVAFFILCGLADLKNFSRTEIFDYSYKISVIDFSSFSILRVGLLSVVYLCGISRPLWPTILLSVVTLILVISKAVFFFGFSPINFFFKDIIIVTNFIFAIFEWYVVHVANRRAHRKEEHTKFVPNVSEMDPQEKKKLIESSNKCRFNNKKSKRFYENYTLRATSPDSKFATWINYHFFNPSKDKNSISAEIFAIIFDLENDEKTVARQFFRQDQLNISQEKFDISIQGNKMSSNGAYGKIEENGEAFDGSSDNEPLINEFNIENNQNEITWDISFTSTQVPLLLYEEEHYARSVPKQLKMISICPSPRCDFGGSLSSNYFGELEIDGWIGSQSHSWGSGYPTDRFFGQVCQFDSREKNTLEIVSTTIELGCLTKKLFLMVLRYEEKEIKLNSVYRGSHAKSEITFGNVFNWRFQTESNVASFEGLLSAPRDSFITIPLLNNTNKKNKNSNNTTRHLLLTQKATCTLKIVERGTEKVDIIKANEKCFFEIITDEFSFNEIEEI